MSFALEDLFISKKMKVYMEYMYRRVFTKSCSGFERIFGVKGLLKSLIDLDNEKTFFHIRASLLAKNLSYISLNSFYKFILYSLIYASINPWRICLGEGSMALDLLKLSNTIWLRVWYLFSFIMSLQFQVSHSRLF